MMMDILSIDTRRHICRTPTLLIKFEADAGSNLDDSASIAALQCI